MIRWLPVLVSRWMRTLWSRLTFRHRLRAIPAPEGIVRLDVRVTISVEGDKTHYHIRTAAGQPASIDEFAGALCALVAIGETLDDLRPSVRRDLRRLSRAMHNGKSTPVRQAS